jgi:protein O-mannosyl-transferase
MQDMRSSTKRKVSTAVLAAEAPDLSRTGTPWWQRDVVLGTAVFLLALAVFANSLKNDYVYDDVGVIAKNSRLEWPWDLKAIFGTDYWGENLTNSKLYRPLTILSFAVDWKLFGKDPPTGIHAMNILANAAIAVLVYALVRRLWGRRDLALVTAALFAIHPVHTEVVANGVGRSELYMTFFLLCALHLHLTYAQRMFSREDAVQAAPDNRGKRSVRGVGPRRAYPYLAGAAVLFFVALLFKESAVVLPPLVFLIEWLVLRPGRLPGPSHWLAYLAYVPGLAVYMALRLAALGPTLPAVQEVMLGATGGQRFLYASETLLRYIGQLTVPLWLCGEYADFTKLIRPSVLEPMVLASLAAWLVMTVLVFWLARRRHYLILTGIAWFFISILPVSNLLVPVGTIRADRLLYVPSLGFTLIAAWALVRLAGVQRAAGITLTLGMLGFYAAQSVARNRDWSDQETFWTKTVAQNPGSAVAWLAIGHNHNLRNEYTQASAAYRRAWELRDSAGFFYMDAHLNRAQMLKAAGDLAGAADEYRTILQRNPRQKTALINLGELTFRDPAMRAESIELFKRYIAEEPREFRGHANLAQAYKYARDYAQALAEIDLALEFQPAKGSVEEGKLLLVKANILRLAGNIEESERLQQLGKRLSQDGGG